MRKPKTSYALNMEIRRFWEICPVTRVVPDMKKNVKKQRQLSKKMIRDCISNHCVSH